VSNTQVTLVQLDNYGPWTVTPEPRPEMNLQNLQASLFSDLAQLVGTRDGYAFYGRFDNMVAVTNGLDGEDHARIQSSLNDRYPVTVSMAVAVDEYPAAALAAASERLQSAGSAQDADRRSILDGEYLAESAPDDLRVAHFDVVDSTGTYTDEVDAFDAHVSIGSAVVELQRYLREAHDAVAYFVGGDNVIAVCPEMDHRDYEATIEAVLDRAGVELQVGIGTGEDAAEAGMEAKHALEQCRYEGTRIKGAPAPTPSD
jgi:GTP cyclohydrolase IIa